VVAVPPMTNPDRHSVAAAFLTLIMILVPLVWSVAMRRTPRSSGLAGFYPGHTGKNDDYSPLSSGL
jgi:hypothetical protein